MSMKEMALYDSDSSRWQAVVDRDKGAEGSFYYAVITTGIFCRPDCSSRLPNRANVAFYENIVEAERAGFRPCRRCNPTSETKDKILEQKVIDACRKIESSEKPITLDTLAMKPKEYRAGGKGIAIEYGVAECSMGWVIVAATDRGICGIEFGDDAAVLFSQIQERFPSAIINEAGPGFKHVIEDVVDFVDTPASSFKLPLDIQGTVFQQKVWNILKDIEPGKTMSYTEVAEKIGNPNAVRAVATACASNKLAVVIPCHRVISKAGKMSGYRWGVARKKALLENEQKQS